MAHTHVEVRNLTGLYKNVYLHQGISSLKMAFFSPRFSSNAMGRLPRNKQKVPYKSISEYP